MKNPTLTHKTFFLEYFVQFFSKSLKTPICFPFCVDSPILAICIAIQASTPPAQGMTAKQYLTYSVSRTFPRIFTMKKYHCSKPETRILYHYEKDNHSIQNLFDQIVWPIDECVLSVRFLYNFSLGECESRPWEEILQWMPQKCSAKCFEKFR